MMKDLVSDGEELMPNQIQCSTIVGSHEMVGENSQLALAATLLRKLSRNRGLVVQEENVVEESPECDAENALKAGALRRCKRRLH
ncbi:hypothetical protein Fmac_022883 [Flemingia macrophylla]|uniref:Uncharacterized protein n=1 Tax=Flemingia macrophylla TaxID=520843 RepID=A0ABD1LLL2_9FABA